MTRSTRTRWLLAACAALLLSTSAAASAAGAPWEPSRDPVGSRASTLTRTDLGGGIAHYSFLVPVGPGEHDRIRLHRVVQELVPWIPRPSQDAVMLLHGDAWPFETTYLAGFLPDSPPGTPSPAAFLAAGGIDVWGLDFRWALVPSSVTDPSFMAGWDLGTDVADTGVALQVARAVRLGGPRLHLAGYSRGGQVAYAYAAAEAGLPPALRQLRGLIPIDILMKTDVESIRAFHCDEAAQFRALVDAGDTVIDRSILTVIAELALADPDSVSLLAPPFTNAGLALFLAASSSPDSLAPFFHSAGGITDFGTLETTLLYTTDEALFALQRALARYQPRREILDGDDVVCDELDVPYDDGLGDVTLPLLYVGAGGGFGEFGAYTTTLLASTDVTVHLVDLAPPEERFLDFGHQDLLIANDALALVWQPVLDWIRSR